MEHIPGVVRRLIVKTPIPQVKGNHYDVTKPLKTTTKSSVLTQFKAIFSWLNPIRATSPPPTPDQSSPACATPHPNASPEDVGIRDVEGRLSDTVLDVHVGIVLGQQLAGLPLGPVGRSVQRGPAVIVLHTEEGEINNQGQQRECILRPCCRIRIQTFLHGSGSRSEHS